MKKHLEDLTINDFLHVVPWQAIQNRMYTKDFKKFMKWMRGQTATEEGCYPCDLERFLTKGGPKAKIYD